MEDFKGHYVFNGKELPESIVKEILAEEKDLGMLYEWDDKGCLSLNKDVYEQYISKDTDRYSSGLFDIISTFMEKTKDYHFDCIDPQDFIDMETWKIEEILRIYYCGYSLKDFDKKFIDALVKFKNKDLFIGLWIYILPTCLKFMDERAFDCDPATYVHVRPIRFDDEYYKALELIDTLKVTSKSPREELRRIDDAEIVVKSKLYDCTKYIKFLEEDDKEYNSFNEKHKD